LVVVCGFDDLLFTVYGDRPRRSEAGDECRDVRGLKKLKTNRMKIAELKMARNHNP
tara:strand:+ start:13521 stop:13688 length:168 start_codon:yes stop_codon:yes gene_type:complete